MHHHLLSVLFIISVVLLVILATPLAPLWSDIRVMHTWNTVPANWESLGPPPAGTTINLHIALEPHHENALIDALYEVSNPRHKKYGAHLSKEQVAVLVAPRQDQLEIVYSWLEYHGVPSSSISTSHGGGWLTITSVPVSQADKLLCASYQLYRHTGANKTEVILRTVSYALPVVLHEHVQTVAPTTHFASPRTPLQIERKHPSEEAAVMANATSGELSARVLSAPVVHVTPSFLRWLYKTQIYTPTEMGRNALGTLGFQDDYPSREDLTQFMTDFRADAEAATFTVVKLNGGGYDSGQPGVAGSMHTQYAEAMAYPTPHIFYSTGGHVKWTFDDEPARGDGYLEWLNYLLSHRRIPQTISISYTNTEVELPRTYARALCNLFAQLGVRGASVLVASGDDGVGRGHCTEWSGKTRFIPMFPASCPYLTSVGGTTYQEPEIAAGFSGGGFSNYFRRPFYQSGAVLPFLQSLGTERYRGFYQPWGRGIPDIASQAQRFVFIRNTVLYETSGTVCSTSTVAGIVSLLNDYQLSKGRAPLGFLNPWLYAHGLQTLNDIVSGSNPGCTTDGFSAVVGWDPVTGLGTLDFEILQAVLDQDAYEDPDDD